MTCQYNGHKDKTEQFGALSKLERTFENAYKRVENINKSRYLKDKEIVGDYVMHLEGNKWRKARFETGKLKDNQDWVYAPKKGIKVSMPKNERMWQH